MSLSNLFFWVIFLAMAVVIDLAGLPRLFHTRLGEKIGSMLSESAHFASEQKNPYPETQFFPGLTDFTYKIQGWFKNLTKSRVTKKDGETNPQPADSIAEMPVADQPEQTNIFVYSSPESESEQEPANIIAIESPTQIEEPGLTQDYRTVVTTNQKSHIHIEISLAPGETVRITVESKPKN